MFKQKFKEKVDLPCDSYDIDDLAKECFNLALKNYKIHAIGDEKQII